MLSVLRHWCPISRLDAWHMTVCDQRNGRHDTILGERYGLSAAAVVPASRIARENHAYRR